MDPFFGRNPVMQSLQRQRRTIDATRENASRNAWSYTHFTTTGSGEIVVAEPQMFTTTFVQEPYVMHGFTCIGQRLIPGRFPRCSAGVSGWVQDTRGYYLGAYVFFTIETSGPDTDPGVNAAGNSTIYDPPPVYTLNHTFTFSGLSFKDLPAWKMTQ